MENPGDLSESSWTLETLDDMLLNLYYNIYIDDIWMDEGLETRHFNMSRSAGSFQPHGFRYLIFSVELMGRVKSVYETNHQSCVLHRAPCE